MKSELGDFFKANAKIIISVVVIFALGVALGVALAFRAVGGEFESVARVDAETGAGKVFFLSLLALLASYALVLLSGLNKKTVFLSCIPYFVIGFMCGRFSAMLLCRYELFGLLNFLFVYLPVFVLSLILLALATVRALDSSCSECADGAKLKPSFVAILKLFGINAAINFVFFILVGLLVGGTILPSLF